MLEGTTVSWSRSVRLRVTGMLPFTPTSPSIRHKIMTPNRCYITFGMGMIRMDRGPCWIILEVSCLLSWGMLFYHVSYRLSRFQSGWRQIVLKNYVSELTVEADIDYSEYLSRCLSFWSIASSWKWWWWRRHGHGWWWIGYWFPRLVGWWVGCWCCL